MAKEREELNKIKKMSNETTIPKIIQIFSSYMSNTYALFSSDTFEFQSIIIDLLDKEHDSMKVIVPVANLQFQVFTVLLESFHQTIQHPNWAKCIDTEKRNITLVYVNILDFIFKRFSGQNIFRTLLFKKWKYSSPLFRFLDVNSDINSSSIAVNCVLKFLTKTGDILLMNNKKFFLKSLKILRKSLLKFEPSDSGDQTTPSESESLLKFINSNYFSQSDNYSQILKRLNFILIFQFNFMNLIH